MPVAPDGLNVLLTGGTDGAIPIASDIVGEEFLLWQVEFYESVLHQNWTTWWRAGATQLPSAPDWGTAFYDFTNEPTLYPTCVSYTTDSAYAAANGAHRTMSMSTTTELLVTGRTSGR